MKKELELKKSCLVTTHKKVENTSHIDNIFKMTNKIKVLSRYRIFKRS